MSEQLNWNEFVARLDINSYEVIIKKPVRKGDEYKKGVIAGFKSGIFGGGHSRYKEGFPHSFDSNRMRWIKKPKVHVAYNVFTFGKSQHTDWIDADNCLFVKKEDNDRHTNP